MLLDISLTALDRKRKFWALPGFCDTLESEITEHVLVDILDLVNIGTVFYGLDVVVTEGNRQLSGIMPPRMAARVTSVVATIASSLA